MTRAAILTLLISWTVSIPAPSHGAEAEKRPPSVLAGVVGLEKQVAYSESKIPLGELVAKVAADTGVPLTAAKDVADEPVALFVKDFPARELLEQLADLLDYRWSRRGVGQAVSLPAGGKRQAVSLPHYEIWQDLASKQREAALREALFAEPEKELRDQIRTYAEVAALPPEQLQRLVEEARKSQEELRKLTPEESQRYLRDPQNRERSRRHTAALALQSPLQGTLARVLLALREPQWAPLREGDQVVFSTDPKQGELRLPAEMERRLREAHPTTMPPGSRLAYPTPEAEEKLRRQDATLQAAWAAATGFRVQIELDIQRLQTQGAAAMTVHATPFRTGAPLNIPFITLGTDLRLSAFSRSAGTSPEEDTPEARAALAKDPVVGVPRTFRVLQKPLPNSNGPTAPLWWRLLDLLPEIAGTYDVQFISDAYWASMPALYANRLTIEPMPLYELLERSAGSTHRWDRRGKLIRLRSRKWFLDRAREVPLRLVRRWQTLIEQQGALPMEAYTEMASALTDPQLEGLSWVADVVGLPPELQSIGFQGDILRLYAALSASQRESLWRGKRILMPELTAAQRVLFLNAVHRASRRRPADLAQFAASSISLKTRAMTRVRQVAGEKSTWRDEPAAAGQETPPTPPAARGEEPRRYSVLGVTLELDGGPNWNASLRLAVPAPVP